MRLTTNRRVAALRLRFHTRRWHRHLHGGRPLPLSRRASVFNLNTRRSLLGSARACHHSLVEDVEPLSDPDIVLNGLLVGVYIRSVATIRIMRFAAALEA